MALKVDGVTNVSRWTRLWRRGRDLQRTSCIDLYPRMLLFCGFLLLGLNGQVTAAELQRLPEHRITGIDWQQTKDAFLVIVFSEIPPTYTMYELPNPRRIILDIADVGLAESAGLPLKLPRGPVSAIAGRMLGGKEPFITRIEMVLSANGTYTAERVANRIILKFPASSGAATPAELNDVVVTTAPGETRVLLQADRAIEKFRKAGLPADQGHPDRLYIDIPDIRMMENFKLVPVGSTLARVRVAHRGSGLRVVFDSGLDQPFDHEIKSVPQGLLITIAESGGLPHFPAPGTGRASKGKIQPVIVDASSGTQQPAIKRKDQPSPAAASPPEPAQPARVAGIADFEYQKISVDFFKIDLHNVFRLIGEISGNNIVVDEGVSGTVTLALTEVPWDFVLDVVLNLKNLQKEERYNTIVISPKSKEFQWPKRALDQLAVKAEGTGDKLEAITVKQRLEAPVEITEAKKLINQGNDRYRAGDYQGALNIYEEAFALWPENKQLASRITAMALVHLGMNAKAVHYAKTILELDPQAVDAALHAAIGLANMKKTAEAKSYFDLAISGQVPSAEALLSYAAFCEENSSYEAALNLLATHERLHGNTLESMVAKARLYDQMGRTEEATREYRTILLSGFEVPADLQRYIQGRTDLASR